MTSYEEPKETGGEEPKLTANEEPKLADNDEPQVTGTRWRRVRRPSWVMIGYAIGLLVILGVLGSLAMSGVRSIGRGKGSEEGVRGQRGKGKRAIPKKKRRVGRLGALPEAPRPRTIDEANVEPLCGGPAGGLPRGAEARFDPGSRETRADGLRSFPLAGPLYWSSPPFRARQDPHARPFIREAGEATHAVS